LEEDYPQGVKLLAQLIGPKKVRVCLPRLNEIHASTEALWRRYAEMIPGGVVKYLLIAEAPPWSVSGPPKYVLDPGSRPRSIMRALRGAFSLSTVELASPGASLAGLASRGLLVVDSLPFAADYGALRSKATYGQLVAETLVTYMRRKLAASGLTWSPYVRLAFSLKRNATAIMAATSDLALGARRIVLSEQDIAVNAAGYPDVGKLRKCFALPQD
jgi:hypothetical protein